MLDAMIIMKPIWEDNEGKYTRVDGIKRCWRKANILPVSWECDINNDVGHLSAPTSTNNLKKYYCEAKESCVSVSQEAHDIKGSLVSDGSFTKAKLREMAKNRVQVEYDPNIINAEVDEAIELLKNVT